MLPRFVKQYEASQRRLYQQFKRLSEDIKMVSTTIQNIQDEFAILEEIHSSFNNDNRNKGLCVLYKGLNEGMGQWSNAFIN